MGGLRLEPKPTFFQKLEKNPKTSKALSKAVLGLSDLTLGLDIHITRSAARRSLRERM